MAYIGIPPFGQTIRSITSTTATSGQTTFNITGGYVVGYVDVFLNGILLTPSDYTATDGLSVVLASGAATGDEFQALAYQPVSLVDTYRKSEVDSAISAAVAGVDLSSKVSKTGDTMTGALVTPMVVTDSSMNFRNRIINGDMRIAQRGTSTTLVAGTASGFKCVDRWGMDWSLNGSVTVAQVSDAPPGFKYSLKSTVVTASTDSMAGTEYFSYRQPIEGFNLGDLAYGTASAKPITVSFWVKASTPATYSAGFRATLASGTHGNHRSFTINTADTWEYKTLVFNGSTSSALSNADTNSTAMELFIAFTNGANVADPSDDGNWTAGNYIGLNSNNGTIGNFGALAAGQYIAITGVQLEVGSVATEFERRPYGTELSLCERYYQIVDVNGQAVNVYAGTVNAYSSISFDEMRAVPTVVYDTSLANSGVTYSQAATANTTYENNGGVSPTVRSVSWSSIRTSGTWPAGVECAHTYVRIRLSSEL